MAQKGDPRARLRTNANNVPSGVGTPGQLGGGTFVQGPPSSALQNEGTIQAQQDTVPDGSSTERVTHGYDRNEQKKKWKGRCLICGDRQHDHWKRCDRECYHCKKNMGISGPNTHFGEPCPNIGFHKRWWKDIGGAPIGDTNWNKEKIQTQGKSIQQKQGRIEELEAIVDEQARDLRQTDNRIENLEATVEEQKRDLHEAGDRIENLEATVEEQQGQIVNLEATVVGKEHGLHEERKRRRNAENDLHDVQGDLTESKAYSTFLETKLKVKESRRDRSRSSSSRRSGRDDKPRKDHREYRSRSHNHRHSHRRTRSRSRSPNSTHSTRGRRGEETSESRSHRHKHKSRRPSEGRDRSRSPCPQIKVEGDSDDHLSMGGSHDDHRTHSRRDTRRRDNTDNH